MSDPTDEQRCCAFVSDGFQSEVRCRNRGTIVRGEDVFCHLHDPEREQPPAPPAAPQPPALSPALRREVADFAVAMERKLSANDHKGGWGGSPYHYLHRRLQEEAKELRVAMEEGATPEQVTAEAADVANFAMMLADNYRRRYARHS